MGTALLSVCVFTLFCSLSFSLILYPLSPFFVFVRNGWMEHVLCAESSTGGFTLVILRIAHAALPSTTRTRVEHIKTEKETKQATRPFIVYVYARAAICVCVQHVSKWESMDTGCQKRERERAQERVKSSFVYTKHATGSKVDVHVFIELVYICHVLVFPGYRRKKTKTWKEKLCEPIREKKNHRDVKKNELRFSMHVTILSISS